MMKSFCTTAAIIIGALAVQVVQAQPDPPTLSGQTFKITLIEADGFVTIDDTAPDGYSGYIIDMIANVAAAADFKYELSLPSGFGFVPVKIWIRSRGSFYYCSDSSRSKSARTSAVCYLKCPKNSSMAELSLFNTSTS